MLLNRVFRYDLPTVIEFGTGAVTKLGELVKELNGSKVFLVTDPGVQKAGVTNVLVEVLEKEGIPYSDGQIEMLKRAAKEVGLNFDELLKIKEKKEFPKEIFKK